MHVIRITVQPWSCASWGDITANVHTFHCLLQDKLGPQHTGKGDRSSPSVTFDKLKDSDTMFGTQLQKASTVKDLLSQEMMPHNFMSSSQARWGNTFDRITSLTFSEVFLFCTPIHTTEVPLCFFTMVSQFYHHDITLSHFIPIEVTVSADI